MKKIILAAVIFCNFNIAESKSFPSTGFPGGEPSIPQTINQFDSVFFDVALAVVTGNSVEFPVYLKSDDVINALDFAFKFDHTHLEYDTIINLTSYIDPLAYYNPNDSTVRLTSYSFTQPYVNDTPLFKVRFNLLSGVLCSNDLDSISSLLNGDASTYFVSGCVTGIAEHAEAGAVQVFPNPSSDLISFELKEKAVIEIVDFKANLVMTKITAETPGTQTIDISRLSNGIYILKISGIKKESHSKFVIKH